MNKFRKLGLIDYNGGLKVRSSLLNVVLHDSPPVFSLSDQPGPRAAVGRINFPN